ncbi:MAG: pyridoxine 5'-phosphate synthase [Candidatus Omnitrophica bacterium]|nr:pyridoxine 5'-phosphate synthase [Candidatus Omnitrophota bacterium]
MELGINIDHIATLRQLRLGTEPEPAFAALVAQSAGADSIVAHLREDRRHINERDIEILKEVVRVKFNLEMSIAKDIVEIACCLKPDQATLVPEKRKELTTEGGLDVIGNLNTLKTVKNRLEKQGIALSLFIDPDKKQIGAAKILGVKMIELHTGRYADAKTAQDQKKYFRELVSAVTCAKNKGLRVFAGHGLNYYNVSRVAKIKGIEELNIGYSIICRAALVGLERAVKEMKALIS